MTACAQRSSRAARGTFPFNRETGAAIGEQQEAGSAGGGNIRAGARSSAFDRFECAIQAMAPVCEHSAQKLRQQTPTTVLSVSRDTVFGLMPGEVSFHLLLAKR
jgi:hypothetical protein